MAVDVSARRNAKLKAVTRASSGRDSLVSEAAEEREKVRLSLDVSPELNILLDTLASKTHSSKSDVLRKAIVLMDIAVSARERGQSIGVAERGGMTLLKEIIAL